MPSARKASSTAQKATEPVKKAAAASGKAAPAKAATPAKKAAGAGKAATPAAAKAPASAKAAKAAKAPAKATKEAAKKAPAKKEPAAKKETAAKATAKTPAKPAKEAPAKPAKEAKAAKSSSAPGGAAPGSPFPAKFLEEQHALLMEERTTYLRQAENLRAEADSLVADFEPGDVQFDEESGEGDTISVERERDLALSASARAILEEIDRALAKLETGTYGICEVSGKPIPKERLQAIPWARERVEYKIGGLGRR